MANETVLQQLRYRVLGPVALLIDGEEQKLGGAQRKQVLGLLIAAEGRTVSVDQLIDDLWPEEPPASARKTVQVNIHHLRTHVGDALTTEAGGYRLDTAGAVDAVEFEALVKAGRDATDPVAAATSFRNAVELWRGVPYGDTADLASLDPERVRLEELRLVALEGLYDARLRTGAVTELVPDLEGAVASNPLRDRLRRQLMLALYRAGRERDALDAFQSYRAELAEVGLEPPEEAIELERQILQRDPSLEAEASGHALLGYQITERLGEGAFSVVYRGLQPSVGREVAIKQIRAELANRPEFIRRFEAEANMVAHLEHPHIVPLIDYWREPGSAYLVMRLLRGGSLETSVLDAPWDLERTVTMATQIGSALASAHRAGIVHRDVKSANILLDEEGNAYLSDFGIALEATELADPEVALSAGSPAYASPEQLRREPIGPGADVHGLAIAVFEALTGRLPFPDEPNQAALLRRQLNDPIPLIRTVRSDLPPALDDVLQRATAKSPTDRFQTAEEFVEALAEAAATGTAMPRIDRSVGTQVSVEDRNPYKGLRAFHEADAGDFAGRDRLVDQLVDVLGFRRVVAVVGPSGSGKSSVVRAGLLPALRDNAIPGSDRWYLATLMPGARPFEEMEAALTRLAADHPTGLLDLLTDGERGIGRAVRRILPEDGQLLLVVDQFEELFTMCPDEQERKRFLDGLASAVTEERSRLRIVFTLRADFYDRPLRYESIGRLVRDATVAVLPLAADELEHAILDPARSVGAEFEPGLVSELVADVADEPGALPMLQYALTELYERRVANVITRDAYAEIGGLSGALAKRADDLYVDASDEEQSAIRRIFGRLVTLGEGVEDTRRRALRSEVATSQAAIDAMDAFGEARLLSFDTDPTTREPTVEVAHEALIREWPRFREWLDEDRESLRILRHINSSAAAWEDAERPDSELYRGGRLDTAEAWLDDNFDELSPMEREFVAAGVRVRDEEHQAERRTRRRLQRLLVGVGIVAVIALLAGAFAFQQQRTAADERDRAEANAEAASAAAAEADAERARAEEFAAGAEASLLTDRAIERAVSDRRLGMLLALEAMDRDSGTNALGGLQRILVETPGVVAYFGAGRSYLDTRWLDQTTLVALRRDALDVIDLESRAITATFEVAVAPFSEAGGFVAFDSAPGAGFVAIAVDRGIGARGVEIVDVSRGERRFIQRDSRVTALDIDPSGTLLAIGDARRDITLFDPRTGAEVGEISSPHDESGYTDVAELVDVGLDDESRRPVALALEATQFGSIHALAFDETGSRLASASGAYVREWDPLTRRQIGETRFLFPPSDTDGLDEPSGFPFERVGKLVYGDEQLFAAGRTSVAVFGATPWPDAGLLDTRLVSGEDFLAGFYVADDGHPVIARSLGVVFELEPRDTEALQVVDTQLGRVRGLLPLPGGGQFVVAADGGLMLGSLLGDQIIGVGARVGADLDLLGRNTQDDFATVASSGRYGIASNSAPGSQGLAGQPVSFDIDTREKFVMVAPGRERQAFAIDHPARDLVVLYGDDVGLASVVDLATGEVIAELTETNEHVVVSPDSRWLVHASPFSFEDRFPAPAGERFNVVDLESGAVVHRIDFEGSLADFEYEGFAQFSPGGERLAVRVGDDRLVFYETDEWTRIEGFELEGVAAFRFTARSQLTVVTSSGVVEFVSIADQIFTRRQLSLPGISADTDLAPHLSSDGALIFSTVDLTLYDADNGAAVGVAFPETDRGLGDPASSQQDLSVATMVDGNMIVWNMDTSTWRDAVCAAVGRNMTRSEWERFGPAGDYEATCPQWPIEPAA